MRAMDMTGRWRRAALAAGSVGLAIASAGCGVTREATSAPAQAMSAAAGQSGLPIVVSCEPTQRTIVRPTIVNGAAMSQVECVAGENQAVASAAPAALAARSEPAAVRTFSRAAGVSGYRRHRGRAGSHARLWCGSGSCQSGRLRRTAYTAAQRQEERGDHRVLGRGRRRGRRSDRRQEGGAPGRCGRRRRGDPLGPGDSSKKLTRPMRRSSGSGAFPTSTHVAQFTTARKSASCAGRRPASSHPRSGPNSLDFRPHACPGLTGHGPLAFRPVKSTIERQLPPR